MSTASTSTLPGKFVCLWSPPLFFTTQSLTFPSPFSHVHWYERTYPLLHGGDVDHSAVLDNRHFLTNEGKSMLHLINGMAGNIESHTTLRPGEKIRPLTAALDDHHYGFSTMSINETTFHWQFIRGDGEGVQDEVVLQKAKCSV